jgi:hypothetical protein
LGKVEGRMTPLPLLSRLYALRRPADFEGRSDGVPASALEQALSGQHDHHACFARGIFTGSKGGRRAFTKFRDSAMRHGFTEAGDSADNRGNGPPAPLGLRRLAVPRACTCCPT